VLGTLCLMRSGGAHHPTILNAYLFTTHLYIHSYFLWYHKLVFFVTFVWCPRSDFYLRHLKLNFLHYITLEMRR